VAPAGGVGLHGRRCRWSDAAADGIGGPDNWKCAACGNENWPSRVCCNRCGAARADSEVAEEGVAEEQQPMRGGGGGARRGGGRGAAGRRWRDGAPEVGARSRPDRHSPPAVPIDAPCPWHRAHGAPMPGALGVIAEGVARLQLGGVLFS
jgi:hypothetical protein